MKTVTKRISSLMLAVMMLLSLSCTAFAAEPVENDVDEVVVATEAEQANEVAAPAETDAAVMSDLAVSGIVPAWGTITLWPHLSSYVGFSKTIRIQTRSSGSQGGVDLELKKNGSLVSDGNWIMGIFDTGDWKLTLPQSGDYELIVHNHSGSEVYVTAQWL